MTPLDHATAHETLLDLALEPGALDRLFEAVTSSGPVAEGAGAGGVDRELVAHLAACTDCRREAEAARRTDRAIRATSARGGLAIPEAAVDAPIRAPASLRASIVAIPRTSGGPERSERSAVAPDGMASRPATVLASLGVRGSRAIALAGLAAVLVISVVLGSVTLSASDRAARASADQAHLQTLVASLERIVASPSHWTVPLRAADGSTAGTIAWSDNEIAVVATGLPAPAAGSTYRCWIERRGTRTAIGAMDVVGGTASWVGSVDAWGTVSLAGGGRFVVSLEPGPGGTSGPTVLAADLPS